MSMPDRHIKLVEKLHGDFNEVLKISREEIANKYGCDVRQGDNIALNLLIEVMQLVPEDI